jgi:hypothetical protein
MERMKVKTIANSVHTKNRLYTTKQMPKLEEVLSDIFGLICGGVFAQTGKKNLCWDTYNV